VSHNNCKDAKLVNGVRACGHSVWLCAVCDKPVFGGNDCGKCVMAQVERMSFGSGQKGQPFAVDAWPNEDEQKEQSRNG